MILFLVPLGRGRLDLYAEPLAEEHPPVGPDAGRVAQAIFRARVKWREYVDVARAGGSTGRIGRWRDSIVCALADSIDQQRTLSSLRHTMTAIVRYPSTGDLQATRIALDRILQNGVREHGRWLTIYVGLFIVSGVLFFVPGPNVVAYYLGFRAFGHLQSWRGARHGRSAITWTLEPSDGLAELAALADVPHAARAARVRAIADSLELPHLPSFFERAAA